MAITITTNPTTIAAAGHPIIFEATSNRDSEDAVAVTSVSSGTGAKARYAVASHTFLVGDVITGSAFTGINVAYNVRQTVTVVSALYFETDLAFVATATGAGTATRTNDNFQLREDTIVFDQTKNNITTIGDNGGFAQVSTSGAHNLSVGDYVLIQNNGTYDGIHKLTAVTTSTYITATAWTSNTGAVGTSRGGRIVGTNRYSSILLSAVESYRINVAGHLLSVMAADFIQSTPSTCQSSLPNSVKLYAVLLTEEFDDADGLIKEGANTLSTYKVAIRAMLNRDEGVNINTYYKDTTIKFLTYAPITKKIRYGEEVQLHFLYGTATTVAVSIFPYDLGGSALAPVIGSFVTITDEKGVCCINTNHFTNSYSKFDVLLSSPGPNGISETRTYIIDKNAYQNPVRIYWENNLGGIEDFTFTGRYTQGVNEERTSYRKSLPLTYASNDRAETQLQVTSEDVFEVYSDLLNRADARLLKTLLNSTNVWIKQIGDTKETPIIVLNDSAMIYDSDQPNQMKLTYKLSVQNSTLNN